MPRSNPSDDEFSDEERDDFPLTGPMPGVRNTLRWSYRKITFALTLTGFLAIIALASFVAPAAVKSPDDPLHRSSCLDYPEDCRTTAPFVFDTVFSLLKQWPNTYAPNGHSIVLASLPRNTQLYHARPDGRLPKIPTFFALDAEMSLGIYGGSGTPQMYTMMTTRKLNLIYFDGQSASLTRLGTLDAQMALLQNQVPYDPGEKLVFDEGQRATDLCALTKELKIDGVARMNAGFEVMLCNYLEAGVVRLYSSNVTVPGNRKREEDQTLPKDPNRVPPYGFGNEFAPQNSWEWIRSGTWHYGVSAADAGSTLERRLQLDLCGFLSYYDPFLRSLSGHHHGGVRGKDKYQNGWGLRRGHRLLGISQKDVALVKRWLKRITNPQKLSNKRCSGTQWQALTETITNQHRTRVREIFATMKASTPTIEAIKPTVKKIHELSHAILYTYLQYPTAANISATVAKNLTIARCSSVYTEHIELNSLNEFEILIKESISIVMSELCSWEWDLFEWSELHTTNIFGLTTHDHIKEQILVEGFEKLVEKATTVMNWLGWDDWHGCDRKCQYNELCYIPMWPVVYAPGKHQGGIYADGSYTDEEMYEFWRPKCLNRTLFDRGGGRGREPSHQIPDVPDVPPVFVFP